ncbi:conjugal transfer protein [Lactiplantibacillus paraxiangfangensis]|uniref:conjugal transfer protein n=1 Tax=Lactiplantibacillus paraxiangfangensis TaxID=3076224 RepID=UPI0030C67E0E
MRVRVKDFPIRYNDKRYLKGEELTIAQEVFNGELFVCLDKVKKDDKTAEDEEEVEDDE